VFLLFAVVVFLEKKGWGCKLFKEERHDDVVPKKPQTRL
jgi:hypothetical protein